MSPLRLMMIVGVGLCLTLPAHAVNYWVRGEAAVQGNGIPADCPAAGTRFSAVVYPTTKATCEAHATCTAAKVQAVNNWIAQLNQRELGHCVQFVQQAQVPCSYSC
ncbi:hypothetical protein [Rhodobacter sp. CZR27]|uniref:hypothetical protein n=1 Tax=Rhodobacter sp. CZR27 TaxID=2033869 RepID=UPI000BBED839|nr:hypothetical protein [Rhodobacter sp. CZR27]